MARQVLVMGMVKANFQEMNVNYAKEKANREWKWTPDKNARETEKNTLWIQQWPLKWTKTSVAVSEFVVSLFTSHLFSTLAIIRPLY